MELTCAVIVHLGTNTPPPAIAGCTGGSRSSTIVEVAFVRSSSSTAATAVTATLAAIAIPLCLPLCGAAPLNDPCSCWCPYPPSPPPPHPHTPAPTLPVHPVCPPPMVHGAGTLLAFSLAALFLVLTGYAPVHDTAQQRVCVMFVTLATASLGLGVARWEREGGCQ